MIILGVAKILLAVLFGGSLLAWLQAYPESVLGVLLLFSGLELALVCRDQKLRVEFFTMLVTVVACLAINTGAGFVIGWIFAALLARRIFRAAPPTIETGGDR